MNFRKSLAVILLGLGCAVVAHGQAGVYIGYTGIRLSGIECFSAAPVPCANGANAGATGNVNPSGIQFGGYYDFKTLGPVRLGLDLRGGDFHSNKSAASSAGGKNTTGFDNGLMGLRGSFYTKYTWLSPYAQVSAGYARSNASEEPFGTPNPTTFAPRAEDNFLIYEVFAGLDIHVFPVLDLRPVELGIGNMNRFGSGSGTSSIGVKTIGAAIVFHMPSAP
jgi:hypothetical protein